MIEDGEHRPASAGFGIGSGKHKTVESRVNHGSGAHGAGLQRDIKRAAGEPVIAIGAGSLAQGDDFRVGGWVAVADHASSARAR